MSDMGEAAPNAVSEAAAAGAVSEAAAATGSESRRSRWSRWRRPALAILAATTIVGGLVVAGTTAWTRERSAGSIHTVDRAPRAPVVVVFGTAVAPGGAEPGPFLTGRLEAAARLVAAGRAQAVLVSGDAAGDSGNEVAAMRAYLIRHGVPAARIAADPYGLDTYDTCARAARTFGVRRALLATQPYHLPRAVALCRAVGIDAHGVRSPCRDCAWPIRAVKAVREAVATTKAAIDAASRRSPAVVTPPDPALGNALRR